MVIVHISTLHTVKICTFFVAICSKFQIMKASFIYHHIGYPGLGLGLAVDVINVWNFGLWLG